MKPPALLALLLVWVVSSVLSYGLFFAYLQGKFPSIAEESYREDMGVSALAAIVGGPFTLFIIVFLTGFAKHGVKFK